MEEDNLDDETQDQQHFEGNLEELMNDDNFKLLMMDYLLFFNEYVKTTDENLYKRAAEYASDLTGFVILDFEIKDNSEEENNDE
jgi:hypothetical protein